MPDQSFKAARSYWNKAANGHAPQRQRNRSSTVAETVAGMMRRSAVGSEIDRGAIVPPITTPHTGALPECKHQKCAGRRQDQESEKRMHVHLHLWRRMTSSENRFPLFGVMR
jgi:hypothetical protein